MSPHVKPRVLPADVYDALELSAYAYGGIGRGRHFNEFGAPCCLFGHAGYVDGGGPFETGPVRQALFAVGGLDVLMNDRAVNSTGLSRVPWRRYCRLMGIVRGES